MGAFFTNLHVRADSRKSAVEALKSKLLSGAYVSPCENKWVSVFPEQDDGQDEEEIQSIAKDLSQELETAVFLFVVHDSDIFCYWLYVGGKISDSYNSNSDYFHNTPEESKREVAGRPEKMLPYCRQGTTEDKIAKTLRGKVVFEENRVVTLAKLLGISAEIATLGFVDISESEPETQEQFTLIRGAGSREASAKQKAFDAVKFGQLLVLKSLIEAGTSVHLKCPGGNLLGYAIATGNTEMVKLLLDHGADPSKVNGDPFGRPPPIVATFGGAKSEIIELLVKAGANVNQAFDIQFSSNDKVVGQVTPLMCAARFYEPDLVETLLKLGADPEIKDASARMALDYAIEKRTFLEKHLPKAADPSYLKDCLRKLEEVVALLSRSAK